MSEIANFTLGLIVGICSVLLVVVLWGLMNISGQISREEEGQSYSVTRIKHKTYQEPITRPTPLPPDDDIKSS